MRLDIDWTNEKQIRNLFAWQTRVNLAPKFGKCTIHHYQNQQDKVRQVLLQLGFVDPVRRGDEIICRKTKVRKTVWHIQCQIAHYPFNAR
jgi:hypothetical protein